MRFTDLKLLRHIFKNRSLLNRPDKIREEIEKNDPRPVAVVIGSRDDFNGELNRMDIKSLTKKYRVLYFEAETDKEILNIKKATKYKKASLVILAGHGNQRNLELSEAENDTDYYPENLKIPRKDRYLDVLDLQKFKKHKLSAHVTNDVKIVLLSCSTGKAKKTANNLAYAVYELFGNKGTLYSPNKGVQAKKFRLEKDGSFIDPGWKNENMAVIKTGRKTE